MSKLRADEFVNSDDNGAPSFPHSATVPAPTADNHFATKLYADTSASTKSSSITNTISNTAPSNPSAGDFWTNTSQNIISLNIWNGSSWVNVKNSIEISAGQIVTPPSISDPNGGYIPTMLTATSAVVSDAILSSSKWYKDDVEIPGATGLQYYATDTGTYKYEEIWVDTFGTQLFPSLSAVIDARAGVIDSQPTITSSNGVYSPTTLTATAAVVSNATLVGSKWYKDGVEVPGETGLSINILAHEGGIYKYEETWTDHFGTQLLPTLSASVQVFATIATPSVLSPADDTGVPDFDYTALSSAITNIVTTPLSSTELVDATIRTPHQTFSSSEANYNSAIWDPVNNKIVIAYSDGSNNYGKMRTANMHFDGNNYALQFSPEFTFNSSGTYDVNVVYAGNGKIVVSYLNTGENRSESKVGTYQAHLGQYSFGSPESITGSTTYASYMQSVYDPINDKVVISYNDGGDNSYGKLRVGTISGTSISYGSPSTFEYSFVVQSGIVHDPTTQKIVIAYKSGQTGKCRTATVSGTNISLGPAYEFRSSSAADWVTAVQDPNSDRIVFAYHNVNGFTRVVKVNSDDSFTFGPEQTFNSGYTHYEALTYHSPTNKIVLSYQDRGPGASYDHGKVITGSIDPTDNTITFNNPSKFNLDDTSSILYTSIVHETLYDKVAVFSRELLNGSYSGKAIVITDVGGPVQVTEDGKTLTLTDTTVSKVSDGSLINGTSIDQVLTVGETVQALGGEPYWIATLGSTDNDYGFGTAVDSSGNIYVTGYTTSSSTGYFDCSIAKYNSSGVIQWQRKLSSSLNDQGRKIAVDSSGNVYIVGNTQTSGRSHVLIAKYNSSGSIQWQRTFSGTGPSDYGKGIAVDSSGNVYIVGYNQGGNLDSGNDAAFLAKYNTSGTLQWQRLFGSSSQDQAKGVAVDSSGNVYVVGDTVGSNYDMFITKWNASGTIEWQRTLGGTSIEYGSGIAVDSSGNAYIIGQTNSHTSNVGHDFLIAKYNSSGTIQWQRYIGGASNDTGGSIAVDSSGKIYVTGSTYSAAGVSGLGNNDILIAKYENDGTIEWQRFLGGTGDDYSDSIQVDSSGNVYIAAYTSSSGAGSNDILIAKLPDDGSLTGTYGSYTYTTSSLTAAEPSLTSSTSSLTDSALSFTSSTSSLTESASDATSSTTAIAVASGTVSAFSGNTITLSDVSGTWLTGMNVQGASTDTKDNPDPINPSAVSLTSSEPATTQGSVTTWGNAQWQIAEDSGFTTNLQSLTSALTSSGTQTGPTGFALDYNKNYYVRTKYGSSNPAGVFSNWSVASLFKTKEQSIYADDVFSTYLYEGNANTSGSQTINNGIDLAGEGGMVWIKRRTAGSHTLYDTERGATQALYATTDVESARPGGLTSFNNNGFTVGNYTDENAEGQDLVAWTFRKAPGFFDIVTYTGTGSAQNIAHSLGSEPGMIWYKPLDDSREWMVYHRSLGASQGMILNMNIAAFSSSDFGSGPTSTHFSVGNTAVNNTAGKNYVAYIFAHDDQSFGTDSDQSIIKCGSYTGNGSSTGPVIDLGFEPQFLLQKRTGNADNWLILDNMRGFHTNEVLYANTDDSEAGFGSSVIEYTSTGFKITTTNSNFNANGETYVYMAIRRPHKPATVATDVFTADDHQTGNLTPYFKTGGHVSDFVIALWPTANFKGYFVSRITGKKYLIASEDSLEGSNDFYLWDYMDGMNSYTTPGDNGYNHLSFKRSPGFCDVVAYTGTGSNQTVTHNLGAVPELIILKKRNNNNYWHVFADSVISPNSDWYQNFGTLNTDSHFASFTAAFTGAPTSTTLPLTGGANVGASNDTYVAYLFASQPGVSKVGSYTGTGGNVDVDCGFAAGARFVLIKRTDNTGDWYIWDTARGINSGPEPYMRLNETGQEVSGSDYIDPLNAGFTVTSSAPAALNTNGGTYLFFAIA